MKLYISAEMLAVFSLREVELSRRIQCFPTQRERFYSSFLPASLFLHIPPSGPAISRNALLFYRLFFRAAFPHASLQHLGRAESRASTRELSFAG